MTEENMQQQAAQAQAPVQPPAETPGYAKASIIKRVLAVLVDIAVTIPVWVVFHYAHMGFVGGLVTMGYGLFKDGINFGGLNNRSIGKTIMGLQVINLSTGQKCGYMDSLLRQILFMIPALNLLIIIIEFVMVVANDRGIRLGDRIAKTMVVELA